MCQVRSARNRIAHGGYTDDVSDGEDDKDDGRGDDGSAPAIVL